jgi:hypothetical protein
MAIVDAFGGTNYNYLCPSNPEVRKYHSALIRNLSDYDLNAIQLESSSFPAALQHGDHHETFGIQVEPLASELMTLCFCKHCLKTAKEHEIDLAKSRKLIRDIIETSFDMPAAVLKSTPLSETIRTSYVLSTDFEGLREVQVLQREIVRELFLETRETMRDAGTRAKLDVITYGGFSGEEAFGRGAEGVGLPRLADAIDGADLLVYVSNPDIVYYLVKWCIFEAPGLPVYATFRPAYPVLFSRQAVAASVKSALEAGASGVGFYNYGWTPLRNFEWIKYSLEPGS